MSEQRTCDAQLNDGRDCVRNAAVVIPSNRETPIQICRLHQRTLLTRRGLTLTDGGCVVDTPEGNRWYPDARVGIPS